MAKQQIVLTGDKALNRKLRRLHGRDAKKVVRQAARPALKPVLDQARDTAPYKSGAFRSSIKLRSLKRSRTRFGARVTTGKNLFSGPTYYGGFLEYGTKYIQAIGTLKKAAEDQKDRALEIYRSKIRDGIMRLARKP